MPALAICTGYSSSHGLLDGSGRDRLVTTLQCFLVVLAGAAVLISDESAVLCHAYRLGGFRRVDCARCSWGLLAAFFGAGGECRGFWRLSRHIFGIRTSVQLCVGVAGRAGG